LETPPSRGAREADALRYFIHTFGCQMNVHDSERMEEVLSLHGMRAAQAVEDADVVVFNTCSVRDKAEHKLRSEVGKLLPLKLARPGLVIAVAGCVAQQEKGRLLKDIGHVDLVVGPDNLADLPALVEARRHGAVPSVHAVFDLDDPRFLSARPGAAGTPAPASAFVTIMKGCDERCSFCIVPFTRGSERYRPAAEVVDEVRRWVDAGTREVVLLGQTVDSYRSADLPPPESDDPDESQFPHLLRLIAASVPRFDPRSPRAPGLARIRYASPHPRHATASLARVHAEEPLLARHIHLPVQSGSDRVLKRMIRRYSRAEYVDRVQRLQAMTPGLTLSTDIIVGFPGETAADFEQTLSLVREVGFVSLFGFKFSVRPDTPAQKLPDDVPEEEKSDRLARLFELSEEQVQRHLDGLVGTRQEVLLEGPSKSTSGPPQLSGRTIRSEIVHVEAPPGSVAVGDIALVDVVRAYKHSLEGRLADVKGTPRETGAGRRSLPVVS
jgi:tRNA-2-methylthio-N6-dimethylallyladenosine synthase